MKKARIENKFWVVDQLADVAAGQVKISYHLLSALVDKGMISPVFKKVTEGRGRPAIVGYELTGKGRGYLGLSKNWKRA